MGILTDLFGGGKIRAERATVTFGNSAFTIDGYRLIDNGEFRADFNGSSELIGYERKWLSGVVNSRPKTLQALRSLGFSGRHLDVKIGRMLPGSALGLLISWWDTTGFIVGCHLWGSP